MLTQTAVVSPKDFLNFKLKLPLNKEIPHFHFYSHNGIFLQCGMPASSVSRKWHLIARVVGSIWRCAPLCIHQSFPESGSFQGELQKVTAAHWQLGPFLQWQNCNPVASWLRKQWACLPPGYTHCYELMHSGTCLPELMHLTSLHFATSQIAAHMTPQPSGTPLVSVL